MYNVLEMQTNEIGETAFLPIISHENYIDAQSTFYMKCGSACISSVPIHTVMTFTAAGEIVPELTKCFQHAIESETSDI